MNKALLAAAAAAISVFAIPAIAQDAKMSFFVTSTGMGDGANLGGLAGADAQCLKLAEAAGATGMDWKAYLSAEGVNAKDRIGTGPWVNAKGVTIATDVANLHSDATTSPARRSETGTSSRAARPAEPARHPDRLHRRRHARLRHLHDRPPWHRRLGHSDRWPRDAGHRHCGTPPIRRSGCGRSADGTGGNGYVASRPV